LPQIPLVAVGGVTVDNAASFLQAGAVAVGVGSVLLDKAAIDRGDWDLITQKAEKFVEAVAQGRES
nr:2-dehydro-3-deoxyphosphogluconate aldolase [Bacillota bacterium]